MRLFVNFVILWFYLLSHVAYKIQNAQWCNVLLPDALLFIGKKPSNGSYSRRFGGEIDKFTETRFIHCPACKNRTEVPSGGVQYFPPNYSIQHQMVLATLNSSSTHLLCDLCPNEITVSLPFQRFSSWSAWSSRGCNLKTLCQPELPCFRPHQDVWTVPSIFVLNALKST